MATSGPMLLVFLFVRLTITTSATLAKDGIGSVFAADCSVTASQGDVIFAVDCSEDAVVLLQARRTLSRWNWPWASESEPEVANTINRTDPAATLAMSASKTSDEGAADATGATFSVSLDSQLIQQLQNSLTHPMPVPDSDKENKKPERPAALASQKSATSTKGKSFSVKLDSQLLQLSNRTKAAKPSVLAAQTAKRGRTTRSGKSFSVKLDSQLLQHSNKTWTKKLSAAIESTHGASKKHKGASFSVKLDSQLLQMTNASDPKPLAAALAAQGTQEGKQTTRGSTFSVKLDSQL